MLWLHCIAAHGIYETIAWNTVAATGPSTAILHEALASGGQLAHLDVFEDLEQPEHPKSPENPDPSKALARHIQHLQAVMTNGTLDTPWRAAVHEIHRC